MTDHGDLLQRVLQSPVTRRVVVDDVVHLILGGEKVMRLFPVQVLEASVTLEGLPRPHDASATSESNRHVDPRVNDVPSFLALNVCDLELKDGVMGHRFHSQSRSSVEKCAHLTHQISSQPTLHKN